MRKRSFLSRSALPPFSSIARNTANTQISAHDRLPAYYENPVSRQATIAAAPQEGVSRWKTTLFRRRSRKNNHKKYVRYFCNQPLSVKGIYTPQALLKQRLRFNDKML
jgi:hypothetical protein